MLFSTIGQIHIFLWMTGAGMLAGALYSLCAGLRRLLRAGFWLTLLADVLFGVGAACILIAALVLSCYGQVRLYSIAGACLGFALYLNGAALLLSDAAGRTASALRHIFAQIAQFRLIKVIFK